MRTANSQTFQQTDGSFITDFYPENVFYQPPDQNDWQPIDLSLSPANDNGVLARAAHAPAQVSLSAGDAANGFLTLTGGGHTISFGLPADQAPGRAGTPPVISADSTRADYADFLPGGISLRVFPSGDGFKSFLVLPSKPASNTFSFRIQAPGLKLAADPDVDGGLAFTDTQGNVVGTMPRPYLIDTTYVDGFGSGVYSEAVTQTVTPITGPAYLLTLTVDPQYLDSAAYPVYIDPTTTKFPNDTGTSVNDTFASERYPGSNFNTYKDPGSGYHEMWLGHEPGYTTYDQDYIRFNDIATTLGSVHIDSAYLKVYPWWEYYHYQWETTWVERVSEDWGAGTLKWNNKPATDLALGTFDSKEGQWSDGSRDTASNGGIDGYVQDVVNGAWTDHGLMLNAASIGNAGWKRIVSSNNSTKYPKLVVTWSDFAAPSPSVPIGGADTSSRTLTWSLPTGATQTSYEAKLLNANCSTTIDDSSETTTSDTFWDIPAEDTLTDGTTYCWQVRVKYGINTSFSSWSSTATFVYQGQEVGPDALRGQEPYLTRIPFDIGGDWQMSVGVANGELMLDRGLFEIPSYGPPQSLSLSYSSLNSDDGHFGVGWSSNLTQYLTIDGGTVTWQRADGGVEPFTVVDGVGTPAAAHHEVLTVSGSEDTITLPDQTAYVFDDSTGVLKRIEDRFGNALTIAWWATYATATDASGRATRLDKDLSDRITGVTDSAGRSWSFGYDGSDHLTSITDPLGNETDFTYSGDLLTDISRDRTDAQSNVATITWSVDYTNGVVTGVRDPVDNSVANTFAYDTGETTVGLLKEYDDGNGSPVYNTSTYTLDGHGRAVAMVDPESYTTTYTFDSDSNLTELVLPIDHQSTTQTIDYTYDSAGNVLTQTTQLTATDSVVTAMTYNATNDMLTRSDADNDASLKMVTLYTYDGAGHLTAVDVNCTTTGTTPPTDAGTCTGAGTQDDATNLITSYTYTANTQLETETDPLGRVTKHVYDSYGNETETIQNYISGQSATADRNVSTTYAFDQQTTAGQAGLVTSMTDPVANTTSYEYDDLGQQTAEVLPGDSSIPAETHTTTYDEFGNVLTETDSWTGVQRTTTHIYDAANREASLTDPAGDVATVEYDAAGDAVSSTYGGVTTTRSFDGLGQIRCERMDAQQCDPQAPDGETTYDYDGQGNETMMVDPEGVATSSTYDLNGRLTAETTMAAAGNLTTAYSYDVLGRRASSTGPDGVASTTAYDRVGRATSTTDAGATTNHSFDRDGNETSTTGPDGTVMTTTYDALNRVTVVIANDVANPTLPTEDVTSTTYYDAAGREIAFSDATGISSRSFYNARGMVSESIANCTDTGTTPTMDPANCVGAGTHNTSANVVSTTDYDGSGAESSAVSALGTGAEATTSYAYDAAGRQQAVRDPMGTVTRIVYDSLGRETETIVNCTEDSTNPSPPTGDWWVCAGSTLHDGTWNLTTSATYDDHGNVASETAPNGRVTDYVYDAADRVIEKIDNAVGGMPAADENIGTYYAYDDAGRQIAMLSPTLDRSTYAVTSYGYDAQGHQYKEVRNCIQSGTSAYSDPQDQSWAQCLPDANSTYDSVTNLVTSYGYDDRGNQDSVTAPDPSATSGTSTATVTTLYAYDDQHRLCGVLENATENLASPDPCAPPPTGSATENVWTSYSYDPLGNMVSMTDAEDHTTSYGYDALGHQTTVTDADGNTTTYAYNDLGQRVAQSANGTGQQPDLVDWTYDGVGRVYERATGDGTTTYTYDDNGNLLSADNAAGTISATYDRLNRPLTVSLSSDQSATTTYAYDLTSPSWSDPSGTYTATLDAFGRQIALSDPVHGASTFTWTYRADSKPASVSAPNGNTTAYGYDSVGQLASLETTNSGGTPADYRWTRNRAGQVLSEDSEIDGDPTNGTTDYVYDSLSRISSATRDSSTTTYDWQAVPNLDAVSVDGNLEVSYQFDAANRQTDPIAYNAEGQLTDYSGQTLAWNDLGLLTTVRDASTNDVIAAYTYDPLDRLLTVDHPGVDDIRFRHVGLTTEVAQVVDDSTDHVLYSVANGWAGERLFEWDGSAETFLGTNVHHDVTWTADASGSVNATLRYDPWGNLTASSGAVLPVFRFQSSFFDPTSQLEWATTRWYSPSLGRFISEDVLEGSLANPLSSHLYAYAEGNPISLWDPAGMMTYRGGNGSFLCSASSVRELGCSVGQFDRMTSSQRRQWMSNFQDVFAPQWFNAIVGVLQGTADTGAIKPGRNWFSLVDAYILEAIQDGERLNQNLVAIQPRNPGNEGWKTFFATLDDAPQWLHRYYWGSGEQPATDFGVARAQARGRRPSLQDSLLKSTTDLWRFVIRNGDIIKSAAGPWCNLPGFNSIVCGPATAIYTLSREAFFNPKTQPWIIRASFDVSWVAIAQVPFSWWKP